MRYEIIYLIGASEEANLEKIGKEVEKIITDFSGVFEEKEWTEKRRLAYQINKDFQGTYIAKRFELEKKENLAEINNQLRLLSSVLRFMITKTDDLPELDEMEKREEKDFQRPVPADKKAERKASPSKEIESEKKAKEAPVRKDSSEDIDKQLEEVLNI